MTYREANYIQLKEAGLIFSISTDSNDYFTLDEYSYFHWPELKLSMIDIIKLVNALGYGEEVSEGSRIIVEGQTEQSLSYILKPIDDPTHYEEIVDAQNYEINFYRRYRDIGMDTKAIEIILLEAEVPSPNLINIRITVDWNNLHGNGKKIREVREITYSGPFIIYWKHDEE